MKAVTRRGKQWMAFAEEVLEHIEKYTTSQYGDYPDDQVEEFELEDFKTTLKRYTNRILHNARGDDERLRDCLKIAHYACILFYFIDKAIGGEKWKDLQRSCLS